MINLETYEFKISIVALIFFDNTPKWLRYHEKRLIDSQGNPLGRREPNNRGGDRLYTLEDIKQMAYILRHRGTLTDDNLKNCLARIESMKSPVFQRKRR
jgi:hypothetical protein